MKAIHTVGPALLMLLASATNSLGQPVITNQPAPQATAPGTTVTFQVGASSAEALAYQWQKNPGNGFSDLADRTNAALVLANVQLWDAADYRVIVANNTGARTSAVAHLYVVRPGLVTNKVVIDNFDDNRPTGWTPVGGKGQVKLIETNQQFKVWGYWPRVSTLHRDLSDTESYGYLGRTWSVLNGQTVEWRVDLVGMNEHATFVAMNLWSGSSRAGYALFKGHDFIHLCKPILHADGSPNHGHFIHETAPIKITNVVLAVAVTRVSPNVIITTRVLDKANDNAVLYERSVVDTPNVDRTLTEAELEAASGMHLHTGSDVGPPLTSGTDVILTVFQYNDGTRPAAEVTYDNLERWTSTWRPEIAIPPLLTGSPTVNLALSAAPNSSWVIERALELTGPWTNLGALLIGPNGSAQFQDPDSPSPARFYRARQQ